MVNMVHKITLLIPLIVVGLIIGVIGFTFISSEIKNKHFEFARGTVEVKSHLINVEIAKSSAERQRWLMFRDQKITF